MITLSSLELDNFLSHASSNIKFDDYNGLVLIEGINSDGHYSSNGSGKSSILEGIIYALTGDTLRGVSVSDVVNRNYKKNTRASLTFKKDDISYSASRYRKHDKYGDSLILEKGDTDISKRVNKETQKSLDDLLGISYKVLVSTILLGEGLSSRFTQLSDPEKKSLIESTLNLSYDVSAIRAKANDKLSQLKLKKSNLEGQLSVLRELANFDCETAEKSLESLEGEKAKASKEEESIRASISEINASKSNIDQKIKVLRDTMNQYVTFENDMNRLLTEAASYDSEIAKVKEAETPCCSVCHQELSSVESKESFIRSYQDKSLELQRRAFEIQEYLSTLPDRSVLKEKYDALSIEISTIDSRANELLSSHTSITTKLATINYQIASTREAIQRYKDSSTDIKSIEKEVEDISSDYDKYDYFYKLFSPTGIIVNILSDAISYINERLTVYSEVLLEKDYHINFLKGKISLVDSKGASYQSLSNGEKRRLDISIQFALHDYVHMYCGSSVDTIFLDEVLDTLDDIGIENIITVLRLKLEYCKLSRVLVISHNSSLKSYFDKVITVSKDKNGDSYII